MISVIIPMYNVENYISDLVKTIDEQTFTDFETIFIDDGSSDKTVERLNEVLANSKINYKIIRQTNKGLSAARNAGIRVAKGEWLVWPDSDDLLDKKYLEILYLEVNKNNSELGFCNYKVFSDGEQLEKIIVPQNGIYSSTLQSFECMKRYLRNWIGPWCFIVSRDFFFRQNLFFDELCRYGEEIIFISKALEATKKITCIENKLYYYRMRSNSILNSSNVNRILNGYIQIKELNNYFSINNSEAGKYFNKVGIYKWLLGTFKKCSSRFSYIEFKSFYKNTNFKEYYKSAKNYAPIKLLLAGKLFCTSPYIFYLTFKTVYKITTK